MELFELTGGGFGLGCSIGLYRPRPVPWFAFGFEGPTSFRAEPASTWSSFHCVRRAVFKLIVCALSPCLSPQPEEDHGRDVRWEASGGVWLRRGEEPACCLSSRGLSRVAVRVGSPI